MNGSNISVLVVEDDNFQRFILADVLHRAGFDVCEAQDADEAIQQLNDNAAICAIITDVEMPGSAMDGLQLATTVHDRWPAIKIIIASGRPGIEMANIPAGSQVFSKPYNSQNVAIRLRDMVEAA